jgi:imidazolonepropionase-like amidohydrolase
MTINAAWQCRQDDIVGSIEEGKLADFVILNEDPMKV